MAVSEGVAASGSDNPDGDAWEAPVPHAPHTPRPQRAVLDAIVVGTRQDSGWVKLRLRLPDGTLREGASPASRTREDRAAASVSALLRALEPELTANDIRVEMDSPALYPTGTRTLVVVHGAVYGKAHRLAISGTAFVDDDTATAAARAALDALNRHLRFRDG